MVDCVHLSELDRAVLLFEGNALVIDVAASGEVQLDSWVLGEELQVNSPVLVIIGWVLQLVVAAANLFQFVLGVFIPEI